MLTYTEVYILDSTCASILAEQIRKTGREKGERQNFCKRALSSGKNFATGKFPKSCVYFCSNYRPGTVIFNVGGVLPNKPRLLQFSSRSVCEVFFYFILFVLWHKMKIYPEEICQLPTGHASGNQSTAPLQHCSMLGARDFITNTARAGKNYPLVTRATFLVRSCLNLHGMWSMGKNKISPFLFVFLVKNNEDKILKLVLDMLKAFGFLRLKAETQANPWIFYSAQS